MESHSDTGERRESSDNIVIGGPEEDENEIMFVGDNVGGGASRSDPDSPRDKSSKMRKYIRHNADQIQELEAVFRENQHPDEKTRLELGTKLSMDSKQVKFWFQNRRTQLKSQLKRHEAVTLKQEKEKLLLEHDALKKAMKNPICNCCGTRATVNDINIDEYQTKIEHDRLKNEVKRINVLAKKYLGPSAPLEGSMTSMMENSGLGFAAGRNSFGGINLVDNASPIGIDFENGLSSPLAVIPLRPTISFANEHVSYDKSKLMDLAFNAMNELLMLANIDEPLWSRSLDGGGEKLNIEEYAKSFTPFIGIKPAYFTTEATRASGIVINNSMTLVETLTEKNRWVEMFSSIIGKTSTFDVISTGIGGNRSGTLLLIRTEFQIISDLVSVREVNFLRFCQQHAEGIWAIVDVSVDTIQEGPQKCEIRNCRRLPSGCIVQDMSNGYSKVTWIEHMEYNENFVHQLYRPLISIGLGFGAQRWMAILQRQSKFLAVMMSSVDPTVISSGQRSIGMLAQRMTRIFCTAVCATIHKWETIQLANGEDARLMVRKNVGDPSEPIGVVLSATKTIWLPVKQQRLFEFFMNEQTRSQWDALSSSSPMQQMSHISKGQNRDSSISLFCANGDDISSNQNNMLILQDTCKDATGSLLVYAKIDSLAINVVMSGGDSSSVALLPSGIAIVPDCFHNWSQKKDNDFCSGSLVTILFQVLANNSPVAKLSTESLEKVKGLISHSIHGIKTALKCK
ncbi:homeobox-leucine zipper protein ROC5-like [Lycium barbarum]|uniref:homeobox-leucine zipper protein ROC5-like n=1 Tax=Lycium barbarum TaxID=112863 RepID=UPI00293F11E1|nr:homeobox-leucine zipper protein ROC5-like [Lycium barbarum]